MNRVCLYCGNPLSADAAFCGNCGKRQDQAAFAPPPGPNAAPFPPQYPAPAHPGFAPPAPPQYQPPMLPRQPAYAPGPQAQPALPMQAGGQPTVFDVIKSGMYQMPKVTLNNASVVLEAGQLHYMIGNIQMTATGSLGGFAKSFLTKEKGVRPVYQGTGEIYLTPTFGDINILELNGEEWILDQGAYVASDASVELGVFSNSMMNSLFGGEGMFQTKVSGRGKVFYWSPGPVQRLEVQGQTLTVDGSFAVARTGSLEFRIERATKKLWGSMISGEGMVNTFTGYGAVMIAPIPNRYLSVEREFGSLYSAIRSIRTS